MAQKRFVVVRSKPFKTEKVGEYRYMVEDGNSTVFVYDSVAGHFTRVHSLGSKALAKIRKAARQGGEESF